MKKIREDFAEESFQTNTTIQARNHALPNRQSIVLTEISSNPPPIFGGPRCATVLADAARSMLAVRRTPLSETVAEQVLLLCFNWPKKLKKLAHDLAARRFDHVVMIGSEQLDKPLWLTVLRSTIVSRRP